jgi:hypothetical protein
MIFFMFAAAHKFNHSGNYRLWALREIVNPACPAKIRWLQLSFVGFAG